MLEKDGPIIGWTDEGCKSPFDLAISKATLRFHPDFGLVKDKFNTPASMKPRDLRNTHNGSRGRCDQLLVGDLNDGTDMWKVENKFLHIALTPICITNLDASFKTAVTIHSTRMVITNVVNRLRLGTQWAPLVRQVLHRFDEGEQVRWESGERIAKTRRASSTIWLPC